MALEIKEEPKAGVPAFMATFADLMTLLLVFFILLNVYAKQRQTGLLDAMSGSFSAAFHGDVGQGGILSGSEAISTQGAPERTFAHRDEEPGNQSRVKRKGDEVELQKSSQKDLERTEEVEVAVPFSFRHASAEIPPEGIAFLDNLARDLRRGKFLVRIQASAAFIESMQPMDLAVKRIGAVTRYLKKVGLVAEIEPSARVLRPKGRARRGGQASYRGLDLAIIRRR